MKGKLKYMVLAAVALIVLGIGLIGLGKSLGGKEFSVNPFNRSGNGNSVKTSNVVEGTISDIDDFDTLVVNTSSVDFIIENGNEKRIEYCVFEGMEPIVKRDGKKLTIEQPSIEWHFSVNVSAKKICYKLIVPEGTKFDAGIQSTSGDVTIGKVAMSGSVASSSGEIAMAELEGSDLKVNTTSGGIEIADADYSGQIKLTSSSGGVGASNLYCSELSIQTTSGGCSVNDSETKKFTHDTSSGSFKSNGFIADSIDIDSTSASITLTDCKTENIKATSSSGSIRLELSDSKDLNDVRCNTTSGSIKLELPGDESDYSFDILTTSGSIKVGGTSAERKYQNGRGGRTVKATASSGSVTIDF